MLNWRDPANPQSGGAEQVSCGYLKAMQRRGHDVWWFANTFQGAKQTEMVNGIRVIRRGKYPTSILKAIAWYHDQPRFDLVIDQHHGVPWYAPWWCGTKCVAFIHEVLGSIWKSFYRWPYSALGQLQEQINLHLYCNVPFWTASESTATQLRNAGIKRIKLFRYAIDVEPLVALSPQPFGDCLRLITLSRLAINKRIDHAIRAIRILHDDGIRAKLFIVGEGQDRKRLIQVSESQGIGSHVCFAGRVSEAGKLALLKSAHFLIHTSIREGWGLNVIEANAMGTPAIVYPVPGLIDSTVHAHTGLITSRECPAAIVAALKHGIMNQADYERMRVNAWNASKSFSWDKVGPAVCDWLENV